MRFKPWTVCPVASHYTNCAIPSHPLPLQVIHVYNQKVPAEIDYISFKIICQFCFG